MLFTLLGWMTLLWLEKKNKGQLRQTFIADGEPEKSGFELHWLLRVLPLQATCIWLRPELTLEFNGSSEFQSSKEKVRFKRRGCFNETERRIILEDLLGLFRVTQRVTITKEIRVRSKKTNRPLALDCLQSASVTEFEHPEGKKEGDYLDMRQYREGDQVRHILWKIWARTDGQRRYVRTAEKILDPGFSIFMFSGFRDEANARLLEDLTRRERNWLFGIVTKALGADNEELSRTSDQFEVEPLLMKSGVCLLKEGQDHSKYLDLYEEFQLEAHKQRIGLSLVFFPPGGEKDFPLKDWEELSHVPGRKIIIGYFKNDEEEEKRYAEETAKHFDGWNAEIIPWPISF